MLLLLVLQTLLLLFRDTRVLQLLRHLPDLLVALILSDMQGRSDPWLPSTPRSFVKLARLYGFLFKLGMVFECGFWLLHTY